MWQQLLESFTIECGADSVALVISSSSSQFEETPQHTHCFEVGTGKDASEANGH